MRDFHCNSHGLNALQSPFLKSKIVVKASPGLNYHSQTKDSTHLMHMGWPKCFFRVLDSCKFFSRKNENEVNFSSHLEISKV